MEASKYIWTITYGKDMCYTGNTLLPPFPFHDIPDTPCHTKVSEHFKEDVSLIKDFIKSGIINDNNVTDIYNTVYNIKNKLFDTKRLNHNFVVFMSRVLDMWAYVCPQSLDHPLTTSNVHIEFRHFFNEYVFTDNKVENINYIMKILNGPFFIVTPDHISEFDDFIQNISLLCGVPLPPCSDAQSELMRRNNKEPHSFCISQRSYICAKVLSRVMTKTPRYSTPPRQKINTHFMPNTPEKIR